MKYLWLFVVTLCLPARAEVVRAITENLPPYQVVHNGELSGSSVAIVQAMLKEHI